MRFKSYFIALVAALSIVASPAFAAGKAKLELFGVPLKSATRAELRHAFKQNGLRAIRENDSYWVDTYDARGVLDGASDFHAGYVSATGEFAYAQYTFRSFMDIRQVGNVVNMVSTKYGRPTSQQGRYDLGEVTAKWNVGGGMQIVVFRGWPDTTTFLKFEDSTASRRMSAEIEAERAAQTALKARSQSKAF